MYLLRLVHCLFVSTFRRRIRKIIPRIVFWISLCVFTPCASSKYSKFTARLFAQIEVVHFVRRMPICAKMAFGESWQRHCGRQPPRRHVSLKSHNDGHSHAAITYLSFESQQIDSFPLFHYLTLTSMRSFQSPDPLWQLVYATDACAECSRFGCGIVCAWALSDWKCDTSASIGRKCTAASN